MKIQHKSLEIDYELPEITQGDMEFIEENLRVPTSEEGKMQISLFNGQIVRLACKLGWLKNLEEDDVKGMKPAAVDFLADNIAVHINEARKIPLE